MLVSGGVMEVVLWFGGVLTGSDCGKLGLVSLDQKPCICWGLSPEMNLLYFIFST